MDAREPRGRPRREEIEEALPLETAGAEPALRRAAAPTAEPLLRA
jgi:hypothetical protein